MLRPDDVFLGIELQLAVEEPRVGRVADREENTRRLDHRLLAGVDRARQSHARHPLGVVAEHLGEPCVEVDFDLRVVVGPLGHDLRGTQRVAAMHEVHRAGKLREIGCLLHGRVAAAHHHDRLIAKPWQRAIADGAGTDAAVLELLLAR